MKRNEDEKKQLRTESPLRSNIALSKKKQIQQRTSDAPFHIPHLKNLRRSGDGVDKVESSQDLIRHFRVIKKPTLKPIAVDKDETVATSKKKFGFAEVSKPKTIRKSSSIKRDNREKRDVPKKKKRIIPIPTDLNDLIDNKVRKFTDDSIVYLTYAVSKQSEYFTPYSLKEVTFAFVDPTKYYSISRHGVTFWSSTESQFTELNVWQEEYNRYKKLTEIRLFRFYRIWKCFYVWHKTIAWQKFTGAQKFLTENLFIATTDLAKALFVMRSELNKLLYMDFVDVSDRQNLMPFYFYENQMIAYEHTRDAIIQYRERMGSVLYKACYNAIISKGFSPDDEALQPKVAKFFTFIDRAKKRRYCQLLTKFLKYCDYMTLTILHAILASTFQKLSDLLKEHTATFPEMEKLLDNGEYLELKTLKSIRDLPLFVGEMILTTNEVEINPSRDIIQDMLELLVRLFMDCILGISRFQSDDKFLQFTAPVIMQKKEEKLAGEPPDINFVLDVDVIMTENKSFVLEVIDMAYNITDLYKKRFDIIRQSYDEDVHTDAKLIQSVRDVNELRELCERYKIEMDRLDEIEHEIQLGVWLLKQETFRQEVVPVCRDLLNTVYNHIPRITFELVREVQEISAEKKAKLLAKPEMTVDAHVAYIKYLDECRVQLDSLQGKLDTAYDYFTLMKDYDIFVSDDEKENFMDCEDLYLECGEILEDMKERKQEIIDSLADVIDVENKGLLAEVSQIHEEILKDWLIDEKSDQNLIKITLKTLSERITDCQKYAILYKTLQKDYKMEITRYEKLDTALLDIKMRQTLWDSVEEWSKSITSWYEQQLTELVVDDLAEINGKILKACALLERNLPPTPIIGKLKTEADIFKKKLPVLGYLKNPALKTRHNVKIEGLLQIKMSHEADITLSVLDNVNAFDPNIAAEIQDISGQASVEYSLEMVLNKVENTWKEYELAVNAHRDARDVYVLGGIDELQTTLDDSSVNIKTIAASPYVTPIKLKVDEFLRLFDIFGEMIEQWTTCQTNWMYLEAIFSAPDIQRQLPIEARMFSTVDKSWKEMMRRVAKVPLALPIMTDDNNLQLLKNNNKLLEQVIKCLEAYLEVKRVVFPRFYFLSNDELLEILAQARNPFAVQPHLKKCFDAIDKLQFGSKKDKETGEIVMTQDILAMISPEGEKVQLGVGLKARGPVEDWLGKVEFAMLVAIKRLMKYAYQCYPANERTAWFPSHSSQVVLAISQQQWAVDVHNILDKEPTRALANMKIFEQKQFTQLAKLATIARSDINKLLRKVLCALITVDVHARDTISNLVANGVVKSSDFNWLKMLRYYWEPISETVSVKISSAHTTYFYEYLGASGVLVITPLTDRCYLCLMSALQMNLGGAPTGPAGTGKTETTKDLAKALAKQCVVFNCSDGLDYKIMGGFFSGLAQSGAWCCFDEFNRINIEVLSVIAQQLITIRNAKVLNLSRFMFEGREIKLNITCAAFITMNPGYAGRTDLPDNLKALFRPFSMMVPDYALIAEVVLYSEGFENAKTLSRKMVQMYKLCSEQLSQQDHYDFGMRALKSVLVMAGNLKRASPDQHEDITLIAAMRDANIPKFLANDAILFMHIIGDLFPAADLPISDYGILEQAIKDCLVARNLQPIPTSVLKTIQLYETMCVRWGVMLVGPAGSGKTSALMGLADALTKLEKDGQQDESPNYRNVRIQSFNPKSITPDELYGAVDPMTLEWKDGLMGLAMRSAVAVEDEQHQWIVCDGPVDAVWIENLNTVLDDNKLLCLANSERIKLTPWVHMVFEVGDLANASPATVSRCGMVYLDPTQLGWLPLVHSWRAEICPSILCEELATFLINLFEEHYEECSAYALANCNYKIHQVLVSKILMACTLLRSIMKIVTPKVINNAERDISKSFICKIFIWTTLWSIGGNFDEPSKQLLENFVREKVTNVEGASLPTDDIWGYRVDPETMTWQNWSKCVVSFSCDPTVTPYFDMLVPTIDTTKFGYISELLFRENQPVMYTGDTGVGKTVLAATVMRNLSVNNILPVFLNFSAQTSSLRTQEIMEGRLDKHGRTKLGAPFGKRIIFFIDDVNMPKLDFYGSQPPIELLRQLADFHGLYDRAKLFWKQITDVILGAACAPPGGGRNPLSTRFVRHFSLLLLPPPNDLMLENIFLPIVQGFMDSFTKALRPLAIPMVACAIEVYRRVATDLLPTPSKSHYVFNLRDLSKCVQGILQANPSSYNVPNDLIRLQYHESMRVFHDRLINMEDKETFKTLLNEICDKNFTGFKSPTGTLIFCDFIIFGQAKADRVYDEVADVSKVLRSMYDYLDDYNGSTVKEMKLNLFSDAVDHVLRIARIVRAERGNALLVGVSGMGRQSLSRLAAHINGYTSLEIELSRGYDLTKFHEDLRGIFKKNGVNNLSSIFLLTDSQIVMEEFLEDISSILNSGNVPNLFEGDDYEQVILAMRDACNKRTPAGCDRDQIYNYFIECVRANLHVVMCMSPVGEAFRRRCRMFPSLINCCTIDWFDKWPAEALYAVALISLKDDGTEKSEADIKLCESIATICVNMHESIEHLSMRLLNEYKRYYYTTPSSYLELLRLYKLLLQKSQHRIVQKRDRIANGLNKILETNELVAVMKVDLQAMAPKLEIQSAEMKILLDKLETENKIADNFKKKVMEDEAEAKQKEGVARAIADEAHGDLEVAAPALKAAEDALKTISKSDINELKSFSTPPALVMFVMEAVCILMKVKPTWDSAKKLMADVNFLKRLMEFDKEHIQDATLKQIKVYIEHKDFDAAKIEKVSKVAKSVSLWVVAMDKFSKIYKIVEPKIIKAKEAETELKQIMAVLKQKQAELAAIEAQLQALQDILDQKNSEFQIIQDNVNLTMGRMNRAARLTSALIDEQIRWDETVKSLTKELWAIPGDVLIASAFVAYLGAFPTPYRIEMCTKWIDYCRSYSVPRSELFSVIKILCDPYEIRNWNVNNLPRDEVSIENATIATRALRWSLLIDPQEQANRWIRNFERVNNLQVAKMYDSNLIKSLENCLRQGLPFLIEEVEEVLDPTLASFLSQSPIYSAGRYIIRLGDDYIDYNFGFRLYMTTNLANPHYLPDICIKVTLINFLVTAPGLEEQLLEEIVAIELPKLEAQRGELVVRINDDKNQLQMLEDKILKLLFSSKGNILDDELLVDTLNESKETSSIIMARLGETEETEAIITISREKYRPLAARGALLYFIISSLAKIDSMYQFSLKYFLLIFCSVIAIPSTTIQTQEERLAQLLSDEIKALYANVSQGLFERHKLIFSFMLACGVEKHLKNITDKEFDFLIRGPIGADGKIPIKPDAILVTDHSWKCCNFLEKEYKHFSGLCEDLKKVIEIKIGDMEEKIAVFKNAKPSTRNWNTQLNIFQRLLLVNALIPHRLVSAVGSYIREVLGKFFTEAAGFSLATVYADTTNITPLLFILSTGSDPMSSVQKLADEMEFSEKLNSISLGQGQGPTAELMLRRSSQLGHWTFLQNCHLADTWMGALEQVVREMALGILKTHNDFRLFLSSMPTNKFPVSILQNSVKMTFEPPKGLKANLVRGMDSLNNNFFEKHALEQDWRTMVFGLAMFHCVILERKKFGPLGWNVTYEFNDTDLDCALQNLDGYCNREVRDEFIAWDALEFMNGEIVWGGRVTDSWDQRCLKTILKTFCSGKILDPKYKYSPSGIYYCPQANLLSEFKEYALNFPFDDPPEIFGLHESANLVFQHVETSNFISSIMLSQSGQAESSDQKSSHDIVLNLIKHIQNVLVKSIETENLNELLMGMDSKNRLSPLTTVLFQETNQYNKLLIRVHDDLVNVFKAIQGFIVMSENLETVFNYMFNNQVPNTWASRGFLTTKTMGSWILDFQHRIDFMQTWIRDGHPITFWISGFYFPQSLITGTLQKHARTFNIPIDDLKIDFEILDTIINQSEVYETRKRRKSVDFPGIKQPNIGVNVHGIFVEAGQWNKGQGGLCDIIGNDLVSSIPVIRFIPCLNVDIGNRYPAPLYKTQVRAGTLSTTGHSTNFILPILLPSKNPSDFWILRGTALVTSITD